MDEKSFPQKPRVSPRELVGCAAFSAAVWLSSLTWLSPLFFALLLSSWARNRFFVVLMRTVEGSRRWPRLTEMRRALFDAFREECRTAGKTKDLKILEVGVGSGANFSYYRPDDTVVLLDMNPYFRSDMDKALEKYPDVRVERFVIGRAEDMKDIADDEFDVVVCTHLLCSIIDGTKVMEEAKRVLKTGGKLACVEHVGYPKDHLAYWIQKLISPLWSVYCNGCRVDRSFKKELQNVFTDISYQVFYPSFMPMFIRPHSIALATK